MRYQKALIPLDGSTPAEAPLGGLPDGVDELVLCRVLEPHAPVAPGVATGLGLILTQPARDRSEHDEALDYLTQVAASRGEKTTLLLLSGSPADEIVRAAQEQGVDLVALATHGRSGPKRWLLGSVAESVLRRAPCPVLLFPPHGS